MYKIRINCTSQKELTFKTLKITQELYINEIHKLLEPDSFNFIDSVTLLHKKCQTNSITTKSFEFLLNNEIQKCHMIDLILKMKHIGFVSETNCSIQFMVNGIIFINIKFNDYSYVMNNNKKKKNKSIYTVQTLHKRM
uniref:Uncharacterized protein n=1 Tax=viral metagenome TaxID=1070528 RepID=A0A6C0EUL0_9ZZZZ